MSLSVAVLTSKRVPARNGLGKPTVAPKRTEQGRTVHSLQTLLADLATLTINRIQPQPHTLPAFDKLTRPTLIQKQTFQLLGLTLKLPKL